MAVRIFAGSPGRKFFIAVVMNLIRHISLSMLTLAAIIAAGCSDMSRRKGDAVYQYGGIEVYTDSIVLDGKEYNAVSPTEITNSWKTGSADTTGLTFSSGSRMADAMFVKAMDGLSGTFTPDDTDILMLLGIISPEESKEHLRRMATDGKMPLHPDPATGRSSAWAAAAWEIYCVTGDTGWLREAYATILSTLADDASSTDSPATGIPGYMLPATDFFPSWMTTVDLMQIRSLGVNAWRYRTYEVAAEMAAALGDDSRAAELRRTTASLRNSINDTFWDPAMSRYVQYLYGNMFPIPSTAADYFGNALCVLFGIATDEMALADVAATVSLPGGIPLTYPSLRPDGIMSARVQSLHGLAAIRVHDSSAMRRAVGSLWVMSLDCDDPTAWPALLLRGMIGMDFTPEGITVNPFIPQIFSASHTLKGFRYRDAEIDIAINGTGDRIASATLDGDPTMEAFIPADIKGKHTLTITMSGNTLRERELTVVKDAAMPPIPKIYWATPRDATILNHTHGTAYDIYVDGVLTERIHSNRYSLSGGDTQVIDIVPESDDKAGFSPGSHVNAAPGDIISIPASTITPRRAPTHLIKNKEIANRYIELAARHNTRLTFYVNAPSTGTYFLNIMYANGTSETAFRTVEVNSCTAGTIACPPVRPNDWISVRPSTTISIPLAEGPNKLSLYYAGTTILLNEIKLLKK